MTAIYNFRRSQSSDLDDMTQIAEDAKYFLRSKGVSQWQRGTYPDRAVFAADIEKEIGFVIDDGHAVLAVCALTLTPEASYRVLTKGKWLTADDSCYVTVHRSAVAQDARGRGLAAILFASAEEYGRKHGAASIRVDTHPDNKAMQRALEKSGFTCCGELILADGDEIGDERLAYEKVL